MHWDGVGRQAASEQNSPCNPAVDEGVDEEIDLTNFCTLSRMAVAGSVLHISIARPTARCGDIVQNGQYKFKSFAFCLGSFFMGSRETDRNVCGFEAGPDLVKSSVNHYLKIIGA